MTKAKFFSFLSLGLLFLNFTAAPLFAQIQHNVTVSADVTPQSSDYQFLFTTTNASAAVSQETTLNYVITYGASTSAGFASPVTLVADWSSSDALSNVPILEYIVGSATKAYNNTSPVVDLQNRTITWSIPSLPVGTTDQQVSFDLKTNSNYTGVNDIGFTVRANMSTQYSVLPQQAISKTYRYNSNPPTASSGPTPTHNTSPPAAPTQTTQAKIINLSFTTLTAETATILVDTSLPAKMKILYGTSSRLLNQSLTTSSYSLRNQLSLDGLSPGTTYYFRLVIIAKDGNESTSEIFTFQTAEKTVPIDLSESIIILTSQGNILLSDIQREKGASLIALLTPDSDYQLNYEIKHSLSLKTIEAVVRSKVLGITSLAYAKEPQTLVIPMQEKAPFTYFASLKTLLPGLFEVSVRITDTDNNIKEQKVAELKVMPNLSVFDQATQAPIADSRVYLYFYNLQTKKYEPLQTLFSTLANPSYSDVNGLVKVNLPPGSYRAEASAFGYTKKRVDFVLGSAAGEDFPKIMLQKDQTNILNYANYYGNALTDLTNNINLAVNNIADSVRFFNLLSTIILLVTIAVTFIFFVFRTRMHPGHVLPFFTHHVKRLTRRRPLGTFCAIIADEQGKRIKGALISVIDDKTGEMLTSILSNTLGVCYLFNPKEHKNLKLLIIKTGYLPKTVAVDSDIMDSPHGLTIVLKKGKKAKNVAAVGLWHGLTLITGRFFEVFLFVSLILELFFFSVYGLGKTLPFFALSLFNLLLWIFYQREKQERKVFKKD